MFTKYTPSYYSTYLRFFVNYTRSVNCIKFLIAHFTSCKSFINNVCLGTQSYETSKSEKVVKFYVHISPISTCCVTIITNTLINQASSYYIITNFHLICDRSQLYHMTQMISLLLHSISATPWSCVITMISSL